MTKFNIYVLKIFIKYTLIVQALIMAVTMFSSALSHIQGLQQYGITLRQLVTLELITIPMGINSALPITIVASCIVTVLLLMRSNELLAYISIGGRVLKFMFPFVVASFIAFIFMFLFDSYLYPFARAAQQRYISEVIKKQTYIDKRSLVNIWTMDRGKTLINIGFLDTINSVANDITEYVIDDNFQVVAVRVTPNARYDDGEWIFHHVQEADIAASPPVIKNLGDIRKASPFLDDLSSISGKNPRQLSLTELSQLISVMRTNGLATTNYEMILYAKYANALSVIILSILVVPIGINFSRTYSPVKSAATAFALGIAFWGTLAALYSLGNAGVLTPLAANFLPHILFFIIGAIILYRRETAQ